MSIKKFEYTTDCNYGLIQVVTETHPEIFDYPFDGSIFREFDEDRLAPPSTKLINCDLRKETSVETKLSQFKSAVNQLFRIQVSFMIS